MSDKNRRDTQPFGTLEKCDSGDSTGHAWVDEWIEGCVQLVIEGRIPDMPLTAFIDITRPKRIH